MSDRSIFPFLTWPSRAPSHTVRLPALGTRLVMQKVGELSVLNGVFMEHGNAADVVHGEAAVRRQTRHTPVST